MEPTTRRQGTEATIDSGRDRLKPARAGLDRFTIGLAVGVVGLVLALFLFVLAQPRAEQPLDESQPSGVVHNYYLAVLNDNPRQAYSYLSAEAQSKLSYEQFIRQVSSRANRPRIRIDDERIEDGTARVTVRRTYTSSGGLFPFAANEYTSEQTVVLRREDGAWKLAPSQPFEVPFY